MRGFLWENLLLTPDYKNILSVYCEKKVEFLLVGAYAMAVHGLPRATRDWDFRHRAPALQHRHFLHAEAPESRERKASGHLHRQQLWVLLAPGIPHPILGWPRSMYNHQHPLRLPARHVDTTGLHPGQRLKVLHRPFPHQRHRPQNPVRPGCLSSIRGEKNFSRSQS